jgi:hypothetical protein
MAIDEDYELNPPKKVKQAKWATCWAAAYESILAATGSSNQMTEKQLVEKYGDFQGGGGIRPGTLGDIAAQFGFIFNIFLDSKETLVFSDKFVRERLKNSGPVLAACKILNLGGMPGYHAQVIYGVKYMMQSDIGTGLALVSTMNPATGNYESYPISYFQTNTPLFTCWKNS